MVRNKRVDASERVLTPAHIATARHPVDKLGAKIEVERKTRRGGVRSSSPPPRTTSGTMPHGSWRRGKRWASNMRASSSTTPCAVVPTRSCSTTASRAWGSGFIDGVWQNGEPMDREAGDPMLETLKSLSGMSPKDRRPGRREVRGRLLVFRKCVFEHVEKAKEVTGRCWRPVDQGVGRTGVEPGRSPTPDQDGGRGSDTRTIRLGHRPLDAVELKDFPSARTEKVDRTVPGQDELCRKAHVSGRSPGSG